MVCPQIDIEPVSGMTMNTTFRLQFNLPLNNTAFPKNDSFKVKYLQEGPLIFPVFWIEKGYKVGAEDAREFKRLVR